MDVVFLFFYEDTQHSRIYESANLGMKRINFSVIVRPYVCAIGDNELTFFEEIKTTIEGIHTMRKEGVSQKTAQ
jgi:hypothetical protein